MKRNTPLTTVQFYCLADGQTARIEGNSIRGLWGNQTEVATKSPGQLAAELANWDDSVDGVLRWVLRYGPLRLPSQRGHEFAESIEQWRKAQFHIQYKWEHPIQPIGGYQMAAAEGESYGYLDGQFRICVSTLEKLLALDVRSVRWDLLKRCGVSSCRRYFVAEHGNYKYCSWQCSEEASRNSDLASWHRNKKQWRPPKGGSTSKKKVGQGGSKSTRKRKR